MAMYDDRLWILSHIQNSYITSDETGASEAVIQGELPKMQLVEFPFLAECDSDVDLDEDNLPHSLDIASDSDFLGYRQRSGSGVYLEKLKKEKKKNASKVKKIIWKPTEKKLTEEECNELFTVVRFPSPDEEINNVSLLSKLLKENPEGSMNPFVEYSKFDGNRHTNVSCKSFKIFLNVSGESCSDYPLLVKAVASAKVCELIGLICYLYTEKNMEPKLLDVSYYSLHFAEDDGQIDCDFPALARNDPVDKYKFQVLTLTRDSAPVDTIGGTVTVTVNLAGGEFSTIELESKDVLLGGLLKKVLLRRKDMARMIETGVHYHIEREVEPGIVLDLNKTLAQAKCTEFAVVRDNSKRTNVVFTHSSPVAANLHEYQSFFVSWIRKMGRCKANVDFTGEHIEIHPISQKARSSFFLIHLPEPVSHSVEQLVDCRKEIKGRNSEKKSKVEIQVTCREHHKFRTYRFECDVQTGEEIYEKCSLLLSLNRKPE